MREREMCHVTDESSHICEWGIEVVARFGSVLLQCIVAV